MYSSMPSSMMQGKNPKIDLSGEAYNPLFEEIIVHHTATPCDKKYDVDWCRALHKDKGWHDIGYHLYIEADGSISRGRPIHKRGAHCKGRNSISFGIAFVGGLKDGEPKNTITLKQKAALTECIAELRNITGKPLPVFSHRDFRATFCPGFDASKEDWTPKKNVRTRNPKRVRKADPGSIS